MTKGSFCGQDAWRWSRKIDEWQGSVCCKMGKGGRGQLQVIKNGGVEKARKGAVVMMDEAKGAKNCKNRGVEGEC